MITFSHFRRCIIDLLWRNKIKLHKDIRPGDSVDDSGVVDSVGGLEVVVSVGGSVGILMHTPSSHFSSGPQSVLAFSHSFWKIKYSRESPNYVDFSPCLFESNLSSLPLDIHMLLIHSYLMAGLSLVTSS